MKYGCSQVLMCESVLIYDIFLYGSSPLGDSSRHLNIQMQHTLFTAGETERHNNINK
jgi:hypothetical protein